MRTLDFITLAVADPIRSAQLYEGLLGVPPAQSSSTFVLFVLPTGIKIGLWAKEEMKPAPKPAGGVEISFTENSREELLETHASWKTLGVRVVQEPTDMNFGLTFVAEDPDGHRLRPFVPSGAPA